MRVKVSVLLEDSNNLFLPASFYVDNLLTILRCKVYFVFKK